MNTAISIQFDMPIDQFVPLPCRHADDRFVRYVFRFIYISLSWVSVCRPHNIAWIIGLCIFLFASASYAMRSDILKKAEKILVIFPYNGLFSHMPLSRFNCFQFHWTDFIISKCQKSSGNWRKCVSYMCVIITLKRGTLQVF